MPYPTPASISAAPRRCPVARNVEVWIPPSDADLVRRRYCDGSSSAGLIEAAGRFQDADCRFDRGPEEETRIYHPCPWGADVGEEQLPGIAGALALLLRDQAGPVGAVAIGEVFNPPDRFGFVTFGGLDEGGARALAVCTPTSRPDGFRPPPSRSRRCSRGACQTTRPRWSGPRSGHPSSTGRPRRCRDPQTSPARIGLHAPEEVSDRSSASPVVA